MNISDLEYSQLALWGLGKEGMASYHWLRKLFPEKPLIVISQSKPDNLPNDDLIQFVTEENLEQMMDDIDIVIKSPGISLYHPLVTTLKQHKVRITSATNIWFAKPRNATTIAVTGSSGKSTTTSLIANILTGMGLKTLLGGNIGTPLLSLEDDADYYVIELSSYQTADLKFAPNIAILLNLYPEHIQWHQSHAQYYKDKSNLIRTRAETVILNHTDPITTKVISRIPYGTLWFNDPEAIHIDGENIMSGTEVIGSTQDIKLAGHHNYENICAALTLCKALELDLKKCFNIAAEYKGLPHRLENLGKVGAHTYINDSISTTPESALAALRTYEGQNITLIAGGQNRGQDYSALALYIKNHPEVELITIYETGQRIYKAMKDILAVSSVRTAQNLREAVEIAQEITPDDGIILLSPAAPSYDAFLNFEERGDIFRKLTRKIYKTEKPYDN